MSIVVFILVLSFLVIIHELGHLIAAKWAGVKVDEFGVGYPPKALRLFRWKGTDFTLNWIPFGGFVRMQGEMGPEEDDSSGSVKGKFYAKETWPKLIIILAGAFVNFVFGVIAFTIIFTQLGIPEPLTEARIGYVVPDSPAAQAGIQEKVTITQLAFEETQISVTSPQEVIDFISTHPGETISVTTTGVCDGFVCSEETQDYNVYIRPESEIPEGEGAMGIAFDAVVYQFYPAYEMPFRSAVYGIEQAFWLGWLIVEAFSGLLRDLIFSGAIPQEIAGPIGIVHQAQSTGLLQEGWMTVLSFTGMLSVNLAVMNVLPIPPLDGGRAVFVILEALLSRKKIEKLEHIFNYGGYILLFGLIILITIKDIFRIFYG